MKPFTVVIFAYRNKLVFATLRNVHPSLIFTGKAGAAQSGVPYWDSALVAYKKQTGFKVTDGGKRSSLLFLRQKKIVVQAHAQTLLNKTK